MLLEVIYEFIKSGLISPDGMLMFDPITVGVIGGALGALGGSQGDKSSSRTRKVLAPASELEKQAETSVGGQLGQLEDLIAGGPGAEAIAGAQQASGQFASDLEQARATGLRPTGIDVETAQAQLAPQRVEMEQAFEQANVQQQRLAAQLNRPINDPILQAKLQQQRVQGAERLGAQTSALATQNAGQRLGFSEALSGLRQGLASQALQNRLNLSKLGSGILSQQQSFRLGSATTETTEKSGGGIGGAITGAIGGVGAAGSFLKNFG